MIPLRDNIPSRRFPLVTLALVLLNTLAFLGEWGLPPHSQAALVEAWGIVPARLLHPSGPLDALRNALTPFSSMFLHGDWMHLIGNMWFLWIFGDNIEDRMGRFGFLGFYLLAGLVAAASQVVFEPRSLTPVIGASGAIAGVLGAYLRLYPSARIYTVVPVIIFLRFIEIPAFLFLGFWLLVQIVNSLAGTGGVAWWAHIFGFLGGLALSLVFAPPRRRR